MERMIIDLQRFKDRLGKLEGFENTAEIIMETIHNKVVITRKSGEQLSNNDVTSVSNGELMPLTA